MKGVISAKGWELDLVGVRLGVTIGRKRAFAAEEKKSPVVGGGRVGVAEAVGVLKGLLLSLLVGVGVVGQVMGWLASSKRWPSWSSSAGGGQFSLLA